MGGIAVRCGRLGEWGKRRPNDGGCAVASFGEGLWLWLINRPNDGGCAVASGEWAVAVMCGVAVRCGRCCGAVWAVRGVGQERGSWEGRTESVMKMFPGEADIF